MDTVAGTVLFIGSILLLASGVSKIRRPLSTVTALKAAHLPASIRIAIGIGVAEIGAGASALFVARPLPRVAVAVVYLVFAGFLAYALVSRMPLSSCGCTGTHETPPTWVHVGLNAGVVIAALQTDHSLLRVLSELDAIAVPYSVGLGAAAFGFFLLISYLPDHVHSYRGNTSSVTP